MGLNLKKSHIPGLDKILKGGIRENSSILVTGSPGTGKTILGIQFICEGANKGERGVYITSEETPDDLRVYAKNLGFDIDKLEREGKVTIIHQSIAPRKLISIATPLTVIKSKDVKRVVLDSITLFEYAYSPRDPAFKREVLDFLLKMKEANVTLITTSEKSIVNLDGIEYKPDDFLFGGLIVLTKIKEGHSFKHYLSVMKMRGQDYLSGIFSYKIGKSGVKVFLN